MEVTLDAIVDEGYEACCDDNTDRDVRGIRYMIYC